MIIPSAVLLLDSLKHTMRVLADILNGEAVALHH